MNLSFDQLITFSRTSAATYVNSAGNVVSASANVARFDYDPATLAPKGLLIESQRTNLLLRSEEFDNASWGKVSVTVTANSTVSPNETADADTIGTSSTSGYIEQAVSFTGDGEKSVSIFLKAGTSGTSLFQVRDTTAGVTRGSATITWTAGVPSAVAGSGGTVQGVDAFPNGFYRIRLLCAGVVAANANRYRLQPDSGAGTGTVIAWGAQAENGSYATSYIPTAGSQVTRTADVASIVAPNFAPWYNQSEGTFVVEVDSYTNSGGHNNMSVSDGGANNAVVVSSSVNSALYVAVAGVAQANITDASTTAGVTFKRAIAYKANDFAVSTNGGAASTDASGTIPTVDRFFIGSFNGTQHINGHIRSIRYFPTRLSNAQLQALSA